jgi:hypothetical protein
MRGVVAAAMNDPGWENLQRYETAYENRRRKALRELERLQESRSSRLDPAI